MTYQTEFPDFDFEIPALVAQSEAWEDISWANDMCPSFECDVFRLYVDYADATKREFPNAPQFVLTCEDEIMLQTNDWEDVRAFIEDGKRDFPAFTQPSMIDALTAAFAGFVKREGLPEGDASDLLMAAKLTDAQREWLQNFVHVWELEASQDPKFYDNQTVVNV